LVFGYVGFLVFLFEGSARLAFSIPQVAKRLQANDEYTYRRNWVQEHQKYGMEAYHAFDMYDASLGNVVIFGNSSRASPRLSCNQTSAL
jgi:carboxylesterase type B